MLFTTLSLLATAGLAVATSSSSSSSKTSSTSAAKASSTAAAAGMSLCDKYTTALFKDNNSTNQRALIAAVVNRAAAGNTTANPMLTGILVPGTFNGAPIDITPWFTGSLNSSNTGGGAGFSISFVDGGGLAALKSGMPATDDTSNQFTLFTHLYAYFGSVLGCSKYSTPGYPAYVGKPSMFEVHKFMGLGTSEIGYFVEQVGLSAASFGVTTDDVNTIGGLLNKDFNVRCAPKMTIIKAQGEQLQAFCLQSNCKLASNVTETACKKYPTEPKPSKRAITSTACAATPAAGSSTTATTAAAATTEANTATGATGSSESETTAVEGGSATTADSASGTALPDTVSTSLSTSSSGNGTSPMPARQTTNAASVIPIRSLLAVAAFALAL